LFGTLQKCGRKRWACVGAPTSHRRDTVRRIGPQVGAVIVQLWVVFSKLREGDGEVHRNRSASVARNRIIVLSTVGNRPWWRLQSWLSGSGIHGRSALATRSKIGYVRATGRTDAYIVAWHDATVYCRSIPFDELRAGDVIVRAVGAYEFEWLNASVIHLPRHVAGFWKTVCAIGQTHAVVLVDESFVEIS
jgi:hypothetical protein